MKAIFSVEQLNVGDKDFATRITSVQHPFSRKLASFSKNRDFKIQRRGRQRGRQNKKQEVLKTLFCTFLCPFLHDVNMPDFAFYGGRKQATTKFYFSICTWICSLGIQIQEGSSTFDKVSAWVGIIAIKTERTQIHFKRRSHCRRAIGS